VFFFFRIVIQFIVFPHIAHTSFSLFDQIAFGGSALPRQIGNFERDRVPQYIQNFTSQKVDLEQLESDLAITNVWSDMEKCIFLDRFMQHPKDFRKIASFLRNKTAQDCVAYYYDSKKTVPYKFALKEFVMRRKRRGDYHVWDSTIQAAMASGAIVKAGTSEEKPLVFLLPESDETFASHGLHPLKQSILNDIEIDEAVAAEYLATHYDDDGEEEELTLKRKADSLITVDSDVRKYLKVESPTPSEKESIRSKDAKKSDSGSVKNTTKSNVSSGATSEASTPLRSKPQKWTSTEKKIFVETLEKHGRNWNALAQAVGTKSIAQIKNFYYDYKKQAGRGAKAKKVSKKSIDGGASGTKTPTEESSLPSGTAYEDRPGTETAFRPAGGGSLGTQEAQAMEVDGADQPDATTHPPSYAAMLQQEAVSPIPSASLAQQQQFLVRHQLGLAGGGPSLPENLNESDYHQLLQRHQAQQLQNIGAQSEHPPGRHHHQLHNATTEHQLRELVLAQQIQELTQQLAASRSTTSDQQHEWGSAPAAPTGTSSSGSAVSGVGQPSFVNHHHLEGSSLSDETARLLRHHSQSHHQQILSNLLPWVGGGGGVPGGLLSAATGVGGGGGMSDFEQHQLRQLLSLQQQQQPPPRQHHPTSGGGTSQTSHHAALHDSLNLSGLMNHHPAAVLRLLEQQQQQHSSTDEAAQLELLRRLLGGQGG
jgi:hypothetical protein